MKTMRLAVGLLALVCLLPVWTQAVYADDFSISKKIEKQNWKPSIAGNPATGDMVVVWEQLDIVSMRRVVYAAFCKYKGDGKFKVSKPKLLSANTGLNMDPSVAFDGASETYLVVWAKRELTGPRTGKFNIAARKLNSKGKPAGKEFLITKDAEASNPVALILPGSYTFGSPATRPAYLLIWRHMPSYIEPGNNINGLWTVQLDSGGARVSEAVQVFKMGKVDHLGYLYFNNTTTTGKDSNPVLLFNVNYGQGEYEFYLLEVDAYGKRIRDALLSKDPLSAVHITVLSSKLYALSWQEAYTAEMSHQLLKATFKKKGKLFKSDINNSLFAIDGIALDGGGAYVIGFGLTNNNVDFCTINAKGKPVGEPKTVVLERHLVSAFRSLILPDGKVLVVASSRSLDNSDIYELIGVTMDLP